MALEQEYDEAVKPWNRATVAGFGLALMVLLGLSLAQAQIHGSPPSVTSMGFGGRAINGSRPSVTSLGPRGYTPGFNSGFSNSRPWSGASSGSGFGHPHHHPRNPYGYGYGYGVPYFGYYGPGYYDNGYYDNGSDADNYAPDSGYSGGPTVFERGYVPRPPEVDRSANAPSAPEEHSDRAQPQTVLVFKDGHQLEVQNYAIVGTTLYDLTEGHRRKVALAELDLTATSKQNDDRGIDFRLPAGSEAN